MENTQYQSTGQKAEDLVNGSVSEERKAAILNRGATKPVSIGGVVNNLYDLKRQVRQQTYAGRAFPVKMYMIACYMTHLKDPRVELDKKRQMLIEDETMLEEDKEQYREAISGPEGVDTKIRDKQEWLYDTEKVLRDLEKERDALNNEIGNASLDINLCSELSQESHGTVDDKVELKDITRGCQADTMLKTARLNDIEEQIADASMSFNAFYDEIDFLQAEKTNYRTTINALSETQNQCRYLARMYEQMIRLSGPDAIKTGEKLGIAQERINSFAPELEKLQDITNKYFQNVRKFHKTVPEIKTKNNNKRNEQKQELAQISRSQVNLCNERRQQLQTLGL